MLPSDNSLVFRTDDMLKWGVGKGSPLTKEEGDNNLWWILEQIAFLTSNPLQPHEITSITVSDGKISITLSNGTVFGPYALPEQAFNWTGAYISGHDYSRMDVLTASDGAYLVLADHTAPTTFNPSLLDGGGNPVYKLMFAYQNIYDISFYYPGKSGFGIDVGDAMFAVEAVRDWFLPASLTGSVANFKVTPSDGVWVADIQKNGASIGSYTYDPTASTPHGFFTFAADVQFNSGDLLEVIRPTSIDSTAKGFRMTIAAKKGTF